MSDSILKKTGEHSALHGVFISVTVTGFDGLFVAAADMSSRTLTSSHVCLSGGFYSRSW